MLAIQFSGSPQITTSTLIIFSNWEKLIRNTQTLKKSKVQPEAGLDALVSMWMPAVTLNLQNLSRSLVGVSEYSMYVLSNCSNHSWDIMVTRSVQMNGWTNKRTRQTNGPKHNAFADIVGGENIKILQTSCSCRVVVVFGCGQLTGRDGHLTCWWNMHLWRRNTIRVWVTVTHAWTFQDSTTAWLSSATI